MFRKIINFFDKTEDKIRGHLSHYPIIYTLIGSTAIVLFWRSVWHTADLLEARGGFLGFLFYEPVNMIVVVIILLATGLFVSYFIGDSILISGAKSQRKLAEKTSKEILGEESNIVEIKEVLNSIKQEVDEIKKDVEGHHPESTIK